ncbi:NPFFR2 [Mytilus edulis]|uniref:NPFFR2 n=1 Tax=Mytilus edulis TaxID=6550 RepID=A0A8S3V6J3_MYTED|nr:NPFFR2 [Mytilus edulis]
MSGDEHLGDIPGLTLSLSLMCIFAVCLNILLVTGILFTKKQQYSSVELFIVNLSISDILLAGVAVPVRINNASHKGESFVGGDAVCKLVMFLPLLTVSSSIYTMVAIAVDRYKEILKLKKLTTENIKHRSRNMDLESRYQFTSALRIQHLPERRR